MNTPSNPRVRGESIADDELLSDDQIREMFMACGFTIKHGHTDLKPYVFDAARAVVRAAIAADRARRAEPVASAGRMCQACNGAGHVSGIAGAGPDAYAIDLECPGCDGTGELPAIPDASTHPRIGDAWLGGIYAGIACAEDGQPDGHVVLLDDKPEGDLDWASAVKWAQALGDGARLPTRSESALLYANLRGRLDATRWHWTSTQSSEDYAWGQYFDNGLQNYYNKSHGACARAVRRFPVTAAGFALVPVERNPIEGERFVRAWVNLERLPGAMMESNRGRYGPIGALASCCITTSETFRDDWQRIGQPFIEVWLAAAAPQPPAEPVAAPVPLTTEQIKAGWESENSTSNPYCTPLSAWTRAVRWTERVLNGGGK